MKIIEIITPDNMDIKYSSCLLGESIPEKNKNQVKNNDEKRRLSVIKYVFDKLCNNIITLKTGVYMKRNGMKF